jgi:GNAT superfamily N-acetyltransferase
MRSSRPFAGMADVSVAHATPDEVRAIGARRRCDETTLRLSLQLAQDGGAWIARDEAESVGLALASITEEETYVGDLFVEPSFRGQGIGGRLLDAALDRSSQGARMALVEPGDAASAALALRRRLAIAAPVLRFAGAIPTEDVLARMAAGEYRFDVDAIQPAPHAFGLDALDRECRGVAAGWHERFATETTGHAFFLRGEMVAYAYIWADGRVGPLAASSGSYLGQIFAFALVTLRRTYAASWCSMLIPGQNVRLGARALRAGLRMSECFLLARDAALPALDRYIGFHRLLL